MSLFIGLNVLVYDREAPSVVVSDTAKLLNMVYDGIMDKLRESFPHMKDADRLFLMLTFYLTRTNCCLSP